MLTAAFIIALAIIVGAYSFLAHPVHSTHLRAANNPVTTAGAPASTSVRTDQKVIFALARAVAHLQQQVPPSGTSARARAYAEIGLPPEGQNLTVLKRPSRSGALHARQVETKGGTGETNHTARGTTHSSLTDATPWSGWSLIAVSQSAVVISRNNGAVVKVVRLRHAFEGWKLIGVAPGEGKATVKRGHRITHIEMFYQQ